MGHIAEVCHAHLRCEYYELQGHTVDICRRLHKTNYVNSKLDKREQKNFSPSSSRANHDEVKTSLTLTVEQYESLMNLLAERNSNTESFSGTISCTSIIEDNMNWIIDIGATNHMVYSPDILTTKTIMYNKFVHLLDGKIAIVTQRKC